jgi:hypothetical protein
VRNIPIGNRLWLLAKPRIWDPLRLHNKLKNQGSKGLSMYLKPCVPLGLWVRAIYHSTLIYSFHIHSLQGLNMLLNLLAVSAALLELATAHPAASPLTASTISTSGSCGGTSGLTCLGSTFGDCCSEWGTICPFSIHLRSQI